MDNDPNLRGVLIALIIVTFIFAVGYGVFFCGKPMQMDFRPIQKLSG